MLPFITITFNISYCDRPTDYVMLALVSITIAAKVGEAQLVK